MTFDEAERKVFELCDEQGLNHPRISFYGMSIGIRFDYTAPNKTFEFMVKLSQIYGSTNINIETEHHEHRYSSWTCDSWTTTVFMVGDPKLDD